MGVSNRESQIFGQSDHFSQARPSEQPSDSDKGDHH